MTEDELGYFTEILDKIEEDEGPLNDWEKGFMADQRERWEEYGDQTRMSDKQWAIIHKVAKVYGLEASRPESL